MAKLSRRNHSGVAALEFVLVMPVLFLVLLAGVQFASLMVLNNTIHAATVEAARLASMECENTQISARVNEFLRANRIRIGEGVLLTIYDQTGAIYLDGDLTMAPRNTDPSPPDPFVRATLVVSIDATPAPNLLASFCLNMQGKQFEVCVDRRRSECRCL